MHHQSSTVTAAIGVCQTYCCMYCAALLMMDRYCPKLVEFYSKNKFENLVHLAGFIVLHKNVTNQRRICFKEVKGFLKISRSLRT